jgi:hypothetical protein
MTDELIAHNKNTNVDCHTHKRAFGVNLLEAFWFFR